MFSFIEVFLKRQAIFRVNSNFPTLFLTIGLIQTKHKV